MTTAEFEYFPRLSRFYGFTPAEIARIPRAWIRLYLEMIPVLQAEEQLERLQAADQPHIEEKDRSRIHRQLMRIAGLKQPTRAVDPLAQPEALAAMGIKVVRE